MYKQIIIARKDLNMSAGKLAAQVSHASIAFLTNAIRNSCSQNITYKPNDKTYYYSPNDIDCYYFAELAFDKNLFEQWINCSFTKCVLEAKNKNQLLKAEKLANELGLISNKDYFCIYDDCRTELIPEENGRTLTCIGFKPMDSEFIDKIGKKYQLYH